MKYSICSWIGLCFVNIRQKALFVVCHLPTYMILQPLEWINLCHIIREKEKENENVDSIDNTSTIAQNGICFLSLLLKMSFHIYKHINFSGRGLS